MSLLAEDAAGRWPTNENLDNGKVMRCSSRKSMPRPGIDIFRPHLHTANKEAENHELFPAPSAGGCWPMKNSKWKSLTARQQGEMQSVHLFNFSTGWTASPSFYRVPARVVSWSRRDRFPPDLIFICLLSDEKCVHYSQQMWNARLHIQLAFKWFDFELFSAKCSRRNALKSSMRRPTLTRQRNINV